MIWFVGREGYFITWVIFSCDFFLSYESRTTSNWIMPFHLDTITFYRKSNEFTITFYRNFYVWLFKISVGNSLTITFYRSFQILYDYFLSYFLRLLSIITFNSCTITFYRNFISLYFHMITFYHMSSFYHFPITFYRFVWLWISFPSHKPSRKIMVEKR